MPERMTREQSRRPIAGGGFSLMELVVVIAIMAILSVVAVPAGCFMIVARTGTAGRVMVQDLTYARERAMNSGTPSWVVFSTATDSYSILVENPTTPGRAGAQALEDPMTGYAFKQSFGSGEFVGVDIKTASFDGNPEVGFDWLGRSLNTTGGALAAQGSVTLSNGYGCTVEAGTGAITYVHP
jgi:prepilin-type N-terminal cleavage/methylation domain-containing protein